MVEPITRQADGVASHSRWSLWSTSSYLSIGSSGSILSIGSVGSAGSILSVGSAGSVASIASAGSLASALSAGSVAALGAAGAPGSVFGRRSGSPVVIGAACALAAVTVCLAAAVRGRVAVN